MEKAKSGPARNRFFPDRFSLLFCCSSLACHGKSEVGSRACNRFFPTDFLSLFLPFELRLPRKKQSRVPRVQPFFSFFCRSSFACYGKSEVGCRAQPFFP